MASARSAAAAIRWSSEASSVVTKRMALATVCRWMKIAACSGACMAPASAAGTSMK